MTGLVSVKANTNHSAGLYADPFTFYVRTLIQVLEKSTIRKRQFNFSNLSLVWLLWLDPRIQTSHFAKNVVKAITDGKDPEWNSILRENRIVPDAYLIEPNEQIIYVFEIEDTHEIDVSKLRRLAKLWFYLDCEYWELRVFLLDRYLQNWRVLPLGETYYALFEFDLPLDKSGRPKWGEMKPIDWSATYETVAETSLLRPILKKEQVVPKSSNNGLQVTRRKRRAPKAGR